MMLRHEQATPADRNSALVELGTGVASDSAPSVREGNTLGESVTPREGSRVVDVTNGRPYHKMCKH